MNGSLLEILEKLPTVKLIAKSFDSDKEMKVIYQWLDHLIKEKKYYKVNLGKGLGNRNEILNLLDMGAMHVNFFRSLSYKIVEILGREFGDNIHFQPTIGGIKKIIFLKDNVMYMIGNETFFYLIEDLFGIGKRISYLGALNKDNGLRNAYCSELETLMEIYGSGDRLKCDDIFSIRDMKDFRIPLVLPQIYASYHAYHIDIEDNDGTINYMILLSLAYLYKNLKDGKIKIPDKWNKYDDNLWNNWAYFTFFWVALEFSSLRGKYLDVIDKALFSKIENLDNFIYESLYGFYYFSIVSSLFSILSGNKKNQKKLANNLNKMGIQTGDIEVKNFMDYYSGFWRYFFEKFPEWYKKEIRKIRKEYAKDSKSSMNPDELVEKIMKNLDQVKGNLEDIVRKTIEDLLKNNSSGIQLNVSVDSDEIKRIVQEILQDELKKYDNRFDDLSEKIRELRESIEKLQNNNPPPIDIDLSSLESKFDELKNEVLQEMYGKIDEVRNQMTEKINQDIMPKLSQLDNNVSSLATQVQGLSSVVNDLRSEVQTYVQEVRDLANKIQNPPQPQPTQSPAPVPTNGIALKFPGVEFTHEELEILKRFVIGREWSDLLPSIIEKVKKLNEDIQFSVLSMIIELPVKDIKRALKGF